MQMLRHWKRLMLVLFVGGMLTVGACGLARATNYTEPLGHWEYGPCLHSGVLVMNASATNLECQVPVFNGDALGWVWEYMLPGARTGSADRSLIQHEGF